MTARFSRDAELSHARFRFPIALVSLQVLIFVVSTPMLGTPQHSSVAATDRADELAIRASKSFSKRDFKTASHLWQSAIKELETDSSQTELSTRLRLCLAESLTRQADYAAAEKQVSIVEQTIERKKFNNAALAMRLLRRKVQLALYTHNALRALDCQANLCALIKAELGTLNPAYINEMLFLQSIQLSLGKASDSYRTGQQLNTSLEKFGLSKSNNQWELCWMRLGMAQACMNRLIEAEAHLEKCYNLSIKTNSGNAGLAAAWLTTVAREQNDTVKAENWQGKLERVKSDRPAKELLMESQNHLKALRKDWLIQRGKTETATPP